MTWQVGDKIRNDFEINQILTGGFGIIYVCYSQQHKTPCVLKTLQERHLQSVVARQLFEREAMIWTKLEKYPYIVRAYWVETMEGQIFIVLEYVAPDNQGRNTLTHYLHDISLPEILRFAIQFCYGMEYACSKGVDAHRDIKPDNIMITTDKIVKITDFGIAKSFQDMEIKDDIILSEERQSLSIFRSRGKKVCGTLPYMSPEQFDGTADIRSDIYSFGIVLYQMTTNGALPFVGRTPIEYELLHRNAKLHKISSVLFPIIKKCLEKKPNQRYQNFANLRQELQDILLQETGEKIQIPPIDKLTCWELTNKGISLIYLGQFKEANSYFNEALQIDPQNAYAWSHKGVLFKKLGNYQEAITCYDKAINIDPFEPGPWIYKGDIFKKLNKFQEAINCFNEAIKIGSRDADVWGKKGSALLNLGNFQEAINCFNEVIKLNPLDKKAWSNKGEALRRTGKYFEAIASFDEAIKIDPMDSNIWYNKGLVMACLSKFQEAISCYDEALRLNKKDNMIWVNKGAVLLNLMRYQEAIICFDEALKLNPRDEKALYNKSVVLVNLGKYKDAITCCDEAIRINPKYNIAHQLKQTIIAKFTNKDIN